MDMEKKKLIILLMAGLLVVTFTLQAQAKTVQVSMKSMAFQPKELTISAGDMVTWTNNDPMLHDVDLGNMGKSPEMRKGETFSKTFDKAGTYDYDCDIHPGMTGKIIVK
jgi:amicyanin